MGWRWRAGGQDGDWVPDGQQRMPPMHSSSHRRMHGWHAERNHNHGIATTMMATIVPLPSPHIVVPCTTQPTCLPQILHLTMLCHIPFIFSDYAHLSCRPARRRAFFIYSGLSFPTCVLLDCQLFHVYVVYMLTCVCSMREVWSSNTEVFIFDFLFSVSILPKS